MKRLITSVFALLMMVGAVQAEISSRGTVNKVSLEQNYIVINNSQYRMERGKTKVASGESTIAYHLLQQGMKVKFKTDGGLVTEIILITPIELKE